MTNEENVEWERTKNKQTNLTTMQNLEVAFPSKHGHLENMKFNILLLRQWTLWENEQKFKNFFQLLEQILTTDTNGPQNNYIRYFKILASFCLCELVKLFKRFTLLLILIVFRLFLLHTLVFVLINVTSLADPSSAASLTSWKRLAM
jgi:hypothetical protein